MIKDISDVETLVADFVRERFGVIHVHVLQIDYDQGVWTAEGGFVAKDCPLAVLTVKVDKEGDVLAGHHPEVLTIKSMRAGRSAGSGLEEYFGSYLARGLTFQSALTAGLPFSLWM